MARERIVEPLTVVLRIASSGAPTTRGQRVFAYSFLASIL